ncbi:hypothetical protein [Azospirillum thermophilum]|uniref:Uncharacterized protein n=1 Tax=Azospirillum thermophilum TaxID=2202148 RepID=A0A2S2D0R7_9PROT|nr:hypothetical protein [Azospirillum thermophilum]AWK90349.1 hypothetical protein DEW08_30515 [Azospirillum thermophilum]
MNEYKVAKEFCTPTRRFAVGQPVTPADIDGPLPFERWVALGHIAPQQPARKAEKAAAAG